MFEFGSRSYEIEVVLRFFGGNLVGVGEVSVSSVCFEEGRYINIGSQLSVATLFAVRVEKQLLMVVWVSFILSSLSERAGWTLNRFLF